VTDGLKLALNAQPLPKTLPAMALKLDLTVMGSAHWTVATPDDAAFMTPKIFRVTVPPITWHVAAWKTATLLVPTACAVDALPTRATANVANHFLMTLLLFLMTLLL
jgi:hypothetical protein